VGLGDVYKRQNLRPTIKINESDAFNLSDDFAMPNFMDPLESMWGDGKMKVVHGVGYAGQNLSHCRSSDIWSTASDNDEELETGWLGRYYDELYTDFLLNPLDAPAAIHVGSIGTLDFFGANDTNYAFAVTDPQQLFEIAQNGWLHDVENIPECLYGDQVAYLRSIANSTYIYAGIINDAYGTSTNAVDYDGTFLGQQLSMVARLIKGNLGTKVYMVTLDGFDTHAEQPEMHEFLLNQVSEAVNGFYQDLAADGYDDKVLAMTFSEFGRRVEQNSSDGTDHGAAAPVMMFGPALNGNGFLGTHPDLEDDLDNTGNMESNVDFRQIYATVLEEWFCIDSALVNQVLMEDFERLELGFECIVNVPEIDPNALAHKPINQNSGDVLVAFQLPKVMEVEIRIFNVMGQLVGSQTRQTLSPGEHQFSVRSICGGRLATGQYTYQIMANRKGYSRSFVYQGY